MSSARRCIAAAANLRKREQLGLNVSLPIQQAALGRTRGPSCGALSLRMALATLFNGAATIKRRRQIERGKGMKNMHILHAKKSRGARRDWD